MSSKVRVLRDMTFCREEVVDGQHRRETLCEGTICDVIPRELDAIWKVDCDPFHRAALARALTRTKPSVVFLMWNGKPRFADIGSDVAYYDDTPRSAPPMRAPGDARPEAPAWAKLKESP